MYVKEAKKSMSSPGWILLPEQIDALTKRPYAYNATAGSILELLFLQKFWMKLSKFVPSHITPCVLTCLGLVINLGSCLTLLYYSPDAKAEAPSWVHALCGLGVFLYQTLDALDGKQAIKVQDTQIEEVYDHGCDAISNVFITLTTAVAYQMGHLPLLMFLFFIASMLAFYTTHWQDHVTHVMIFGKIDVSEAQFMIMAIHFLTAFYGVQLWRNEVFFGVELRVVLGLFSMLSLIGAVFANIGYILGNKTTLDNYVKVPRKTGIQTWTPAIPVTVLTFFAVECYKFGLFESFPCVFAVSFGLAYSKLAVKLVIANVTYADMDIWDSSLVSSLLLCCNMYLPRSFMIPANTALLCCLVYNMMDVARYFTYVSWDLREALDAYIFTLKYPPGHPKSHRENEGVYVNGLNNNEILSSSTAPKKAASSDSQ